MDAHFGAESTYEYVESVHERRGIWDDGRGARSRVHYGTNYGNAFWDGEQMTYGDGSGGHPLVALDVAADEISHGVTENTATLVYQGDPGGLHEATSDSEGAIEPARKLFGADSAESRPPRTRSTPSRYRRVPPPARRAPRRPRRGPSARAECSSPGGALPHRCGGAPPA